MLVGRRSVHGANMKPSTTMIVALIALDVTLAFACEVDWLSPRLMILLLAVNPIMLVFEHWLRKARRTAAR
jgi:hypothetical protein